MTLFSQLNGKLKYRCIYAITFLVISGILDTIFVVILANILKNILFLRNEIINEVSYLYILALIIIYILKVAFGILSNLYGTKLSYEIKSEIQIKLSKNILDINSIFFNKKSSVSKNISMIFNETHKLHVGYILPMLTLPSDLVAIIGVMIYLAVIDINVFLITIILSFLIVSIPLIKNRKRLNKKGDEIKKNEVTSIKTIESISQGCIEIITSRVEDNFINKTRDIFLKNKNLYIEANLYSQIPRFTIEYSFYVVIIFIIITTYISGNNNLLINIAPPFAFGLMRIMPSLNKIAYFATSYSFTKKYRDNIFRKLSIHSEMTNYNLINNKNFNDYNFISYRGFNFYKNKIHCIIGKSGSGKTTLLNNLIGVNGAKEIFIDDDLVGIPLYRKFNIHYVSQNAYFEENNFFENFRLFSEKDIDQDLIMSKVNELMPSFKLDVVLNANQPLRKILSGGEIQKLSFIRSLLNNPEIIIYDEATSAMDNDSITNVMKALLNYKEHNPCLIIMVSHQKHVTSFADIVYEI